MAVSAVAEVVPQMALVALVAYLFITKGKLWLNQSIPQFN
jgi:hypothetical protein